jgi:hypothetical protein
MNDGAARYRDLANRCRRLAAEMTSDANRAIILRVADDFDRHADMLTVHTPELESHT